MNNNLYYEYNCNCCTVATEVLPTVNNKVASFVLVALAVGRIVNRRLMELPLCESKRLCGWEMSGERRAFALREF